MVTTADLRDTTCLSGYRYVGFQRDKKTRPYHAQIGSELGPRKNWYGPWRAAAKEAAQDYCDYVNTKGGAPGAFRTPTRTLKDRLRFVNHPTKPRKKGSSPVKRAARAVVDGPGYVYLIGMVGCSEAVKVGQSRDEAQFRLRGLQTGNPRELYVIASVKAKKRLKLETELHERFAPFQKDTDFVGEWFPPHKSIFDYFAVPIPAAGGAGKPKEATTA